MLSSDQIEKIRLRERNKYDRNYFLKEYWKEDLDGYSGNRDLSYDDHSHTQRFEILSTAIKSHVRFENMLDVGCGPGLLLNAMKDKIKNIAGIDVSRDAVALAKELLFKHQSNMPNIEVFLASLDSIPFPDISFDLVVCVDVLEHLPFFDIEISVNELFRVCSETLILTINTDNPYKYHPTILSPETWREILNGHTDFIQDIELEKTFISKVTSIRPEYDFYCYKKIAN